MPKHRHDHSDSLPDTPGSAPAGAITSPTSHDSTPPSAYRYAGVTTTSTSKSSSASVSVAGDSKLSSALGDAKSDPRTLNEQLVAAFQNADAKDAELPELRNTEIEEKLTKIWTEIFGLDRISRNDNFFDLGGSSLLGVKLFNAIAKQFGKRLPLITLFEAQTVEQMAKVLCEEKKTDYRWNSLVPINTRGSGMPFFCIHGAGGNVFAFCISC